jgi:uncharacterized protein
MTTLKEQLHADLTTAMKSRNELTTATLRMVLTAVTNEEVAGKQPRTLSDDEVMAVIRREVKKRREAAQAFGDAGRAAQAERETAELSVLEGYLPAQLSDAELDELVASAVESVDVSGPQAMGAVMKAVTPHVAGRAEGGRVAAAVRSALAQ